MSHTIIFLLIESFKQLNGSFFSENFIFKDYYQSVEPKTKIVCYNNSYQIVMIPSKHYDVSF